MAKYTLDASEITSVKQIQKMMGSVINTETGATVEVTLIPTQMLVYTEDTSRVEQIKTLLGATRELVDEIEYEADEDGPAATTLKYAL